jgi:ABC-type multidrug transport system fused ATPase/permease subunit
MSNISGFELMMKTFPKFVTSLAGIIAYSAFIGSINVSVLVLLLGMTIACVILNAYASNYELRHREDKTKAFARLEYFVKESRKLENNKDIRIYSLEDWFVKTIKLLTRRYSIFVLKEQTCYYIPQLSNSIFTIARDLLSYTILIKQVASGLIDATAFVFLTGIIVGFSSWLNQFTDSISNLRKTSITVNSLQEYMDIPSASDMEDGNQSDDIPDAGPSIEFRDVSLTYPEASTPSISHFSLKINAGEKIALVGVNGAGKTTLVKLLSGLYMPSEGDILIDGISIRKLNLVNYQRRISPVFQDVRPLAFTVAENVACCSEHDIDYGKVLDCLDRAGLGEKIRELPLKEKTYISKVMDSEGMQLSGGQLQKLMLARALYKNAPILILDEPTAALDPLAEEQMYMKYNETTRGKTSIFISHRLSSTQFCDRIVFLESGKIAEIGSHKQLMEANGSYADMFYIQSQYYKDNEKEETENEPQVC